MYGASHFYMLNQENTYYDLLAIESLSLPTDVTHMTKLCLISDKITNLVIPNSLETIESGAISEMTNLISLTIPFVGDASTEPTKTFYHIFGSSVKNIPPTLVNLTILGGIIDGGSFSGVNYGLSDPGKYYIKTITLSKDVNLEYYDTSTILINGSNPFSNMEDLTDVYVDSSHSYLKSINGVLYYYDRVTYATICYPRAKDFVVENIDTNITHIGPSSFARHTGLTDITTPSSVIQILHYAFRSSGLTNITVSDGTVLISNSAFYECSNLSNINLPTTLVTLGAGVFLGCTSLTSIVMPSSWKWSGTSIFSGCTNLTEIHVQSLVPPKTQSSMETFSLGLDETNTNIRIYVPSESLEAYKTADGWSTFADRIVGV